MTAEVSEKADIEVGRHRGDESSSQPARKSKGKAVVPSWKPLRSTKKQPRWDNNRFKGEQSHHRALLFQSFVEFMKNKNNMKNMNMKNKP